MGVVDVPEHSALEAVLVNRGARIAGLALLWALPLVFAPAAASAHDVSFSYADLNWGRDRVEVRLSVHRQDAAAALGPGTLDSLTQAIPPPIVGQRLASILAGRLNVSGDGRDLPLHFVAAGTAPGRRAVTLTLEARVARPIGHLTVRGDLFPEIALHETFLNVYANGRLVRQEVLSSEQPRADLYSGGPEGTLAVLGTFVRAGIHHIFIGPDHILFIVGLLILGGSLSRLLQVATSFTVAHSVTLALAALGLVGIPGRVVEPLIALSIVYVGFENLMAGRAGRDWRTRIAFGFGLVHGFGFAGVLREFGLPREALGWSLLAFNVGVEIGQICIVLTVAPLLYMLRSGLPRFAPRLLTAGSWGIILVGAYWLIQRLAV